MTGVLLVVVAIGAVGAAFLLFVRWDSKRHGHMRPTRIHDDRDGWLRFGQAIDKEHQ